MDELDSVPVSAMSALFCRTPLASSSSSSSSSFPMTNSSSSLSAPSTFKLFSCAAVGETALTPVRQARQGLYRKRRGLRVVQAGQMGRPQHGVVKTDSMCFVGSEEEQARQRAVRG